jgi:hypothetical protein
MMGLNEVCRYIKKYNRFLITAHTSPEGDALGAQLGFYNLVRKLGKQAVIVSDDELPYGYDFMPGHKLIRRLNKTSKRIYFDCFVALDCADLKRTGEIYKLNISNKPVLNIDHHISNKFFGVWILIWLVYIYFSFFPQSLAPLLNDLFIVRVMDLGMIIAFMILGYLTIENNIKIKKQDKIIESLVRKFALKK